MSKKQEVKTVKKSFEKLRIFITSPITYFRKTSPLESDASPKDEMNRYTGPSPLLNVQQETYDPREIMRTLATVATALWRVRSKLVVEGLSELPRELRYLPRHVQAAWDALEACHIQVQDHNEERYLPGMAVNPITFQPTPGIATEVISETIKPSVFYKDILIQRADVIVAQPVEHPSGDADSGNGESTTIESL